MKKGRIEDKKNTARIFFVVGTLLGHHTSVLEISLAQSFFKVESSMMVNIIAELHLGQDG